jgi:hypothetical protein
MPKATSRIRTGTTKKRPADDAKDKSHLKMLNPGDTIPEKDAASVPASAMEADEFKPKIKAGNLKSYAGMEAARESLLMRPDNPNRPLSVPGENWKVAEGGMFGRDTANAAGGGITEERTQISTTEVSDEQEATNEARTEQIEAEAEALDEQRAAIGGAAE